VWILGLETATWTASVGVVRDGHAVTERTRRSQSSHAPLIVSLIDEVLAEAGVGVGELDAVAVSAGPGSFTGLRIGVSTAKGLAFAVGAAIIAVPTLTALARATGPRAGTVCTILDARKGEVYAAGFRWQDGRLEQTLAEQAIAPAELSRVIHPPCTFIGDGVDVYEAVLRTQFADAVTLVPLAAAPPSGCVVAQIGAELIAAKVETALATVEPYYVRPSEAELKA